MRYFALFLVILAVGLVAIAWREAEETRYLRTSHAARMQEIEYERAERRDELGAVTEPITHGVASVALSLLLLAISGGIAGGIYIALQRAHHRARFVIPKADGLLPIPMDPKLLADVGALALQAHHQTLHAAASRQPVPASLNYNYHPTITTEAAPSAVQPLPKEPQSIALPDSAPLGTVLGNLTPGALAYGVLPDGTLLTMPMARSYHVLASGDTRSGKSNLLDGIIVQAHHQARALNLRIVAMDVKREMSATWERSNLIETESDPAVILDYLREVLHGEGGVLHRYDLFKAAGEQHGRVIKNIGDYERVTGQRPGHWLIILDELSALFEGSKDKDKEDLVRILQMGAGAGCYILSGAQYITHDLLKRAGSKQFVTRAIFGSYDGTAVNMLFSGKPSDAHRALLTGQPGRGLIRTVGQVEPLAFQALHCTEADILSAITIGADDVLTRDNLDIGHAPATPQHHVSTVPAPHMHAENQECSNEGGVSPEMRRMVWFLKEQKYNKERTIKAIWGCSKGSNEPYRRASQIYDQIVREGR